MPSCGTEISLLLLIHLNDYTCKERFKFLDAEEG
jgi:hypothetical protein